MAEPTGRLTFNELILEAAIELGVAYYGANGDEAAQIPTDAHDLAECKRHVNNALRMIFLHAPPGGWRWARPTGSVVLWASLAAAAARTVTGGTFSGGETDVTANTAVFYDSMVGHTLTITGVGDFVIASVTSTTVVQVTGDASSASGATYSLTATGNYTLPEDFSGETAGLPRYTADTGQSITLSWCDQSYVLQQRTDEVDNDYPRCLAIRRKDISTSARRWEVMAYPVPDTNVTVEFPYPVYFTALTATTDLPPTPYMLDELLLAAVKYIIERDVHRVRGHFTTHYESALLAAHASDGRSAPRQLGYFGNPSRGAVDLHNFRDHRARPAVNTDNI